MALVKSDYLFLIVGTNPFPNLVASITRVKKGGKIYCLYTKDDEFSNTSKVYEDLKRVIEKEITNGCITVDGEAIEKSKIVNVKQEIEKVLSDLFPNIPEGSFIELNYTGGTKVMSAGAYSVFKDFALQKKDLYNFILTYTDGERERNVYELIQGGEEKYIEEKLSDLHSDFELNIFHVIKAHGIEPEDKYIITPQYADFGERTFKAILNEENFKSNKDFLDKIYTHVNGELLRKNKDTIKKQYNKKKDKDEKEKYMDEKLNYLQEKLSDNIFYGNQSLYPEIKSFTDFPKIAGEMTPYFFDVLCGNWLEDYVFKLLLEIKEEGIKEGQILDIVQSVKKKNVFEVDLVILKKYKIFSISLTTMEKREEAISKLYEIKQRAIQLGGIEAGIGFVCLYEKSEEYEKEIMDIWDERTPKNTLVVCYDRFKELKKMLKDWIEEGIK